MSDYDEQTAFLRRMLLCDGSLESKDMHDRIARVQRERACVWKAMWTVIAIVLGCTALSQLDLFQSEPGIPLRFIWVVALAGAICLLAFGGVLVAYRARLNSLRDQCRQLIANVVESTLSMQRLSPSVDHHESLPPDR